MGGIMKSVTTVRSASLVGLLALVVNLQAESLAYMPVANVEEKWATNAAGWKLMAPSDGTMPSTPGSLAIKFAARSLPLGGQRASVYADQTASSGFFIGNYTNSMIDRVTFDVMTRGVLGGQTKVRLTGGSNEVMEHTFPVPSTTGTWMTVVIPLRYDSGWVGVADESAFKRLLSGVVQAAVSVGSRSETAEGMLYIDNFKLIGPWENGPMTADGVPEYWLTQNGFTASAGHATADPDKDGLSNYAEYLAGTDPNDSNSVFFVEIKTGVVGLPVLKWKHVDYRKFTVLEAESLTDEIGFRPVATRIASQEGGNEWTVPQTSGVSRFYRVQVETNSL